MNAEQNEVIRLALENERLRERMETMGNLIADARFYLKLDRPAHALERLNEFEDGSEVL